MPYNTVDQLPKYVQKLPKIKQKQWLAVFNSSYNACQKKGGKKCEGLAFRMANGVAFKDKAKEMSMDILEFVMKTVDGKEYPASDFLVVEDPNAPSKWHLQVKRNGKPDHNLMAAAKAALTSNYRGKAYAGPDKEKALSKLKSLYKSEDMEFMEDNISGMFQFVELTEEIAQGKAFDGVAPGTFTDMWGRTVELNRDKFPQIVANTIKAIAASKTESGEVVGLPIDASNHDKGDAAGWIVGAELADVGEYSIIRFTPVWTELGEDIITKKIRRKFSPTIDLNNLVVLGGTLTNWPATKSKEGEDLLRPIELASGDILEVGDSYGALIGRIHQAFSKKFPSRDYSSAYWVREILDGSLVVEKEEKLYKVEFSDKDGEITFDDEDKWREVTLAYVEQQQPVGGDTAAQLSSEGELDMTTVNLTQEQLAELAKLIAPQVTAADPAGKTDAGEGAEDLVSLMVPEELSDKAKEQRKAEIRRHLSELRRQADVELRAEMASLAHENRVTELANNLVSGSNDSPRGLRVASEELRKHLLKLPPEEVDFWADLMDRTMKEGFVEFSQVGSGSNPKGTIELPDEVKKHLDSKELTVADLSDPVLNLGDISQYNLAKWQTE